MAILKIPFEPPNLKKIMNTKNRILARWSKAGHFRTVQNYGIENSSNSSARYDVREVDKTFKFKNLIEEKRRATLV